MNKKEYIQPRLRMLKIDSSSLLCGSGGDGVTLPGGNTGTDKPTPDVKGDIYGESRRRGLWSY